MRHSIQQLTKTETQSQIIDYRYDALGRKIQETTIDNTTVDKTTADKKPLSPQERGWGEGALGRGDVIPTMLKYHYLPGNRLDKITYPDGSEVQYHFDKDRITAVTYIAANDKSKTEKTVINNIAYLPFGGPLGWTYGNGLTEKATADLDGRVTDIALTKANNENQTLWSQYYQYDLYQNIAQIKRDNDTQQFAYDKLNRLTQEQIRKQKNVSVKRYAYDPLSNRVSETAQGATQNYRYGSGNQMQKGVDGPVLVEAGNTLIEKTNSGTQFILYGQRNETRAIYKNKQLSATYGYDARGWRNRKTTRDAKTQTPTTKYFVYGQDGKLVSEYNGVQRKNYVWLGDTPIAQIEAAANDANIIYLHTDHLATPRVASNDQQTIIWRWNGDAFGNGAPDEDSDQDGKLTHINLRFPGQYADTESGLYYNVHRYYDPEKGRYTQSDPLGLTDGTNSFAYVHGNPVSGVDPLGLYERDVHYYMTYFLAVTAGMTPEDARTMALATQYLDDNPATRPVDPSNIFTEIGSAFHNQPQLLKYHFTLWTKTGPGEYDFTYSADTSITNPSSQQLDDLYGYAAKGAQGECVLSTDTRVQFMGEYLHAFEDTFAHRDQNNKPYEPLGWFNLGTGHAAGGHNPDYTYNHEGTCSSTGGEDPITSCTQWNNEVRTLEMERETYQKIQDYMAATNYNKMNTGKQTDFAALEIVLKEFNSINENADNTGDFTAEDSQKLQKLENWLADPAHQYVNKDGSKIELLDKTKQGYNVDTASQNRTQNFREWDNTKQTWVTLKQSDYPAAILPAG